MKRSVRTTSFLIALAGSALLAVATAFVYRQMLESLSLISANDNERILNALFAGLRNHDTFGSAIESGSSISDRVAGVGVYLEDGERIYSWGAVPDSFRPDGADADREDDTGRYVVLDKKSGSQKFIVRTSRMGPPPPRHKAQPEADDEDAAERKKRSMFFFDILVKSEWVYIDIRHPDYWRERALMDILFPLAGLFLAGLSFFIRGLVLRNAEYREHIEEQKNLVVLGTAASALAHEIKNPLLAIRIQTGILRRTFPRETAEELDIIDAEIERLSGLTYRINDYLREPRGAPVDLDLDSFAREIGSSLCGRDPVTASPQDGLRAFADPERFRSAFGNIIRNAIESGGPENGVEIRLSRASGFAVIEVLDRGRGVPSGDTRRLFEPFFTTKSRGTGIGLAVCRRFIEAAGGTVDLAPRDGGGAVARIRLPEGSDQ